MSLRWSIVLVVILLAAFPALFLLSRNALIEAPDSAEVSGLFPDDVIDWNNPDDHGWWSYTMSPDSERDPDELCRAIHAALVERFPWAVPGTGVVIAHPPPHTPGPPHWAAYCGMPDWWGDPRGE